MYLHQERERRSINHHRDCTAKFKNRRASLEYRWWPAHWLTVKLQYYYSTTEIVSIYRDHNIDRVKLNNSLGWMFHDCGTGICIESMKQGWEDHFLDAGGSEGTALYLHTLMDHTVTRWNIWCDTCGDDSTSQYANCELRSTIGQRKLYVQEDRQVSSCMSCGTDPWFRWRIEAAPTREIWVPTYSDCNCHSTTRNMTAPTFKSVGSITLTTSTAHSESVTLQAGKDAIKMLSLLNVGGSITDTTTWTNTQLNLHSNMAWSTATATPVPVPRGKRLVIYQLVGEAGYARVASYKIQRHIESCTCYSAVLQ